MLRSTRSPLMTMLALVLGTDTITCPPSALVPHRLWVMLASCVIKASVALLCHLVLMAYACGPHHLRVREETGDGVDNSAETTPG